MQASASRREFTKNTGKLAAVSALANVAIPAVHAAGSDLIQVALIGVVGAAAAQQPTHFPSSAALSSWWPWPTSSRLACRRT
jgi:hypothetical protein